MTKAPLGGEKFGPNPTDRGKGGVKRSLLTDGHGLPLALVIDGDHRHDSRLLEQTLAQIVIDKPATAPCSWLCLDLGYVVIGTCKVIQPRQTEFDTPRHRDNCCFFRQRWL